MTPRIQPATPPFEPDIAEVIDRTMRGQPPLHLFAVMARDPRLARKFFAGGLLDKGHLTFRQREILIDRTTALCRSEYEWGVHIAAFAAKAELTAEQIQSVVRGSAEDACWGAEDKLLIRLCDALHRECDVDDALWQALRASFSENAIMEMLMVCGFYRTVSYLTNALRIPLEKTGVRFPA
jgi:alkylhydroperoxidase family enzyme